MVTTCGLHPRETDVARYRHGCDPPSASVAHPSCKSLGHRLSPKFTFCFPCLSCPSSHSRPIIDDDSRTHRYLLPIFMRSKRRSFMFSAPARVVPRAEMKTIPEAPGHELAVPCHECSRHCRRSHRIGFRDHMLGFLGWYPWRCPMCRSRYYVRRSV